MEGPPTSPVSSAPTPLDSSIPAGRADVPSSCTPDGSQVRPSVSDAKETARVIATASPLKRGAGRPRKDGTPTASSTPSQPQVLAATVPGFVWDRKSVQILGEAPIDGAYLILGPGHEHWIKARESIASSHCYDNWAYILNKLGASDPLYAVIALSVLEYGGALARCAYSSLLVYSERRDAARKVNAPRE